MTRAALAFGLASGALTACASMPDVAASPPAQACAPPAIAPPPPAVMGFCPKTGVAARVNAGAPQVAACYERALARDPALSTRIKLVWTIDTAGAAQVLGIARGSVSSDDCLTQCVIDAVSAWRFRPSPGGACRVTFPFEFTPAI